MIAVLKNIHWFISSLNLSYIEFDKVDDSIHFNSISTLSLLAQET